MVGRALFSYLVQLPGVHQVYRALYKKRVQGVIKRRYPVLPKSVNIETFNICNGACVMCPYGQMTRPKVKMSMELFKKIVDELHAYGVKSVTPSFYSEPFLDPDIFDRIKYLKEKKMRVKIFTNASILDNDKIEKLLDCPPDVIIASIDAVNPFTFKKIRTGLDLDIVRENIKRLAYRKKERGLKAPLITTVFVLQDVNKNELGQYKREWEGVVDKVDVNIDNMLVKGIPNFCHYPFPCIKLFNMFIILSDGRVSLCCNDYDGKYCLGDFNKQTFEEIYFGPVAQRYRELHEGFKSGQLKICKDCIYSYDIYSYKWWRK